jgi:hypothetical protein
MEKYKGTPGPWMIVQDEEYDDIKIVEVADYQPGFYTEICEIGQGIHEANLIAAAPDLLEACNQLMHLYNEEGNLLNFNVDIVRIAINKALGGPDNG